MRTTEGPAFLMFSAQPLTSQKLLNQCSHSVLQPFIRGLLGFALRPPDTGWCDFTC